MRYVDAPEVRYAKSGDVSIAYQVVGEGSFDIVYVPGSFSNVELSWTNPRIAAFYRRLASIGRLILFDKRGTACPTASPTFRRWRRGWTTCVR